MLDAIPHWKSIEPYLTTQRTFGKVDLLLDSPMGRTRQWIVKGWFFDLQSTIKTVTVSVNGAGSQFAFHGIPRPDVAAAFPTIRTSRNSGILASFAPEEIATAQSLTVSYWINRRKSFTFSMPLPQPHHSRVLSQLSTPVVLANLDPYSEKAKILFTQWFSRHQPATILTPQVDSTVVERIAENATIIPSTAEEAGDLIRFGAPADASIFAFSLGADEWISSAIKRVGFAPRQVPLIWFSERLDAKAVVVDALSWCSLSTTPSLS